MNFPAIPSVSLFQHGGRLPSVDIVLNVIFAAYEWGCSYTYFGLGACMGQIFVDGKDFKSLEYLLLVQYLVSVMDYKYL